ncbi:hypothetical protein P7K49_027781 [Saguinus oedipus]|uniref:Uncharacterized protein n=1 Tax=Saguinus oedipus TaxID=9490 RepID=A0ABQ9UBR7_SAGOE|nr:hypothetical protein P7K49_027781 [Saguinus oedipus]
MCAAVLVSEAEVNGQFESVCESVFSEVESQAMDALDLPGCFRTRSHSYLRAIQAGYSQDDECIPMMTPSDITSTIRSTAASVDGGGGTAFKPRPAPSSPHSNRVPSSPHSNRVPPRPHRIQTARFFDAEPGLGEKGNRPWLSGFQQGLVREGGRCPGPARGKPTGLTTQPRGAGTRRLWRLVGGGCSRLSSSVMQGTVRVMGDSENPVNREMKSTKGDTQHWHMQACRATHALGRPGRWLQSSQHPRWESPSGHRPAQDVSADMLLGDQVCGVQPFQARVPLTGPSSSSPPFPDGWQGGPAASLPEKFK